MAKTDLSACRTFFPSDFAADSSNLAATDQGLRNSYKMLSSTSEGYTAFLQPTATSITSAKAGFQTAAILLHVYPLYSYFEVLYG